MLAIRSLVLIVLEVRGVWDVSRCRVSFHVSQKSPKPTDKNQPPGPNAHLKTRGLLSLGAACKPSAARTCTQARTIQQAWCGCVVLVERSRLHDSFSRLQGKLTNKIKTPCTYAFSEQPCRQELMSNSAYVEMADRRPATFDGVSFCRACSLSRGSSLCVCICGRSLLSCCIQACVQCLGDARVSRILQLLCNTQIRKPGFCVSLLSVYFLSILFGGRSHVCGKRWNGCAAGSARGAQQSATQT